MALMRWDPGEIDRLRQDMARIWSRVRDDWGRDVPRPHTHMHQDGDRYVAEFELPGVDPDQVEIEVDTEMVQVQGTFPDCPGEAPSHGDSLFRVSLTWPSKIDPETARAEWQHGLLSVTAPKTAAHRRRIALHAP